MYAFEKNFPSAIENFTTALTILVPLLADEAKGNRQELLHKQVREFLFLLLKINSAVLLRLPIG